MGFGDGSGISWTICKQSAPPSRQITTPAPHHSIFMGQMHFLTPNQQCHSTEGKTTHKQTEILEHADSVAVRHTYVMHAMWSNNEQMNEQCFDAVCWATGRASGL